VLRDINKTNREHANRLIHCLTVAIRPLHVEELAEILAVDFDAAREGGIPTLNPDWRWADQHQAVLSTCSSLITIVDYGQYQVVQFSHFSVKEFLTSDRLARASEDISRYHVLLEPAHTLLAQACLSVLLRLDDSVNQDNAMDIPLSEYAARYWVDHAQFERVSSHIREGIYFFFDPDKPHWAAWFRVYNIDKYWDWYTPDSTNDASPLYYASLCGLYGQVERLVGEYPEHINARGGRLVSPLVAALHGRYFHVAELLHQHGAHIDPRGDMERTLLQVACQRHKDRDVVQWLLDRGADVDAPDALGFTPLHGATWHALVETARVLLEHGADINTRTEGGDVPLHVAVYRYGPYNRLDNIQLLLDSGADVNARGNAGSTPLHYWSYNWYTNRIPIEVSRLLLKYGADIDAKNDVGRTPLQLALEYGHGEMARFLLENGASQSDESPSPALSTST
jgi:ankyrin repeat protein